jgi:hypothetical protein
MNAGDGPQSKMLSREEIASLLTVANTCAVNDEFNLEDLVSKRLDSRYVAGVSLGEMTARPCPFFGRSLLTEPAKDKTLPSL